MHITIFVYNDNGEYIYRRTGSVDAVMSSVAEEGENFTLTPPPNTHESWKWVDNKWVKLPSINNPDIPYGDGYEWNEQQKQWVISPELSAYKHLEQQATMWELIKERRLQAVTSGVYVESVDKWFHTDTVSVTTYSTIAGMIALDNYEPLQWKVMDNTWLLLTEPLFKELQTAMSQKTNANYAVAEQHKAAMLEADNPLDCDYSGNWV